MGYRICSTTHQYIDVERCTATWRYIVFRQGGGKKLNSNLLSLQNHLKHYSMGIWISQILLQFVNEIHYKILKFVSIRSYVYRIFNSYSQNKLLSKNNNIVLLFVSLVSKDQESKKENWSRTICCKEDKQSRKRNSYQLGNISRMRNRTRNSLERCCLEGIFIFLYCFYTPMH